MKENDQIFEAEVVEIDGVAVEPRPQIDASGSGRGRKVDWRGLQGKVRLLDKRWMPLWIVLGLIAFVLLVTVGLVTAVIVMIYMMIKALLRAVLSLFTGSDHTLSRRS